MKNEKGITLESLVITIIILLILSSIAVYSGLNTVKYVKFNKAKSEIQLMQTNVNEWYQDYLNGNNNVLYYGVPTSDSSCDTASLTKTVNATGIDASEYMYLSEKYIKDNLAIDSSFEFLVNVKKRNVILFNGIVYQDKVYYTTEDFDIYNVKSDSNANTLDFKLKQGNSNEIIIYDLLFREYNGRIVNISKFDVEYKKTDEADNMWKNITSNLIKFVENGETKYKFDIPKTKDEDKDITYNVRVSLNNKEIANISNVVVESKEYIKEGLIIYLDGENNTGSGHSDTTTIWKDLSGNGNDGRLLSTKSEGPVWQNNSLLFDGVDDYVVGSSATNGDITVEFVGKQNARNSRSCMYMINNWGGNATKPCMQLWNELLNSQNMIYGRFLVPKTQSETYREIGNSAPRSSTNFNTTHYTLKKDESGIREYINSLLINEFKDVDFINRFNMTTFGYTIGKWHSSNSWYSNENVNVFRVYNRALTDEEIAHNYRIDQERFNIEQ